MNKIKLAILMGGKSAEHEVSLISATNVIKAVDKEKYELILIGIDKKGRWFLIDDQETFLAGEPPKSIEYNSENAVVFVPGEKGKMAGLGERKFTFNVDVVFPVLHGTFGEDGTVQGLLKLAEVPFVGAGVLGSSVGMDKDVMKRLMNEANIPIAKFIVLEKNSQIPSWNKVQEKLSNVVFIKPANLGSSVGVSKVTNNSEFQKATNNAFEYDNKILIEEGIEGREVECAVLGNENPKASAIGEVIPQDKFYSYEAKYINDDGAVLKIPAELNSKEIKSIQDIAIRTYKALCCEGMGRVDCFLKDSGEVIANEINTIPGFTSISMYPKLWGISGIKYSELIDELIDLAFERFEKERKLNTNY